MCHSVLATANVALGRYGMAIACFGTFGLGSFQIIALVCAAVTFLDEFDKYANLCRKQHPDRSWLVLLPLSVAADAAALPGRGR